MSTKPRKQNFTQLYNLDKCFYNFTELYNTLQISTNFTKDFTELFLKHYTPKSQDFSNPTHVYTILHYLTK
jgi:hypothetical protein